MKLELRFAHPSGGFDRLWRGIFLVGMLLGHPAAAQIEDSLPQQPAWGEDSAVPEELPGGFGELPTDPPPAAAPAAPRRAARAAGPAPTPSPQRPGPEGLRAETLAPMAPTGLEASASGVPSDTGWHLPVLTDPSSPFFQMEGLRIRLGEVHIRFSLGLSFEYNDNIFNANTLRVADYITTVTPGLSLGAGDFVERLENYVALVYAPQPQIFAENSDQNTVNESLEFAAKYNVRRLTSELGLRYFKDSNPSASDIGRQEYRLYSMNWTNSYAIGTRTALELDLSATYLDYVDFVDYTTLTAQVRIGYELGEKLRLLLGPQVGITYVEDGGEQPFQSILLGFEYNNLRKFVLSGVVGIQSTQFEGDDSAGESNFITPTFNITATYNVAEKTAFALDLNRAVQNSSTSGGQTYINTAAYLSLRQTVLRSWRLSLRFGYAILEYQGLPQLEHTDHYVTVTPSIGYTFWQERCVWSVYYTRYQRTSDNEVYVFDTNVIGTRINIDF